MAIVNWVTTHATVLVTALFLLSEALALIPGVKSNSVFTLIFNLISSLYSKVTGGAQPPAPPAA